jgi:hypothetical protein
MANVIKPLRLHRYDWDIFNSLLQEMMSELKKTNMKTIKRQEISDLKLHVNVLTDIKLHVT